MKQIQTLADIKEAYNKWDYYEGDCAFNDMLLDKVINGELPKEVFVDYLGFTQGDIGDSFEDQDRDEEE